MEKEYIKREDAVKWLTNLQSDCGQFPQMWHYGEALEQMIKLFDADVEPVVRCKDCRYWDEHSQYGYDDENGTYGNYCMIWTPDDDFYAVETPAEGFCYNGKRKDEEVDV